MCELAAQNCRRHINEKAILDLEMVTTFYKQEGTQAFFSNCLQTR